VKGDDMARRKTLTDFAAQVGVRIQFVRLERCLSLRKLAEIAKCCASSVSLIETGRSSIRMQMLRKLALALRVEPFDLLNHDPENNDIGYIVEQMRHDPETRAAVKAQLDAWDALLTRAA